jgi:pimeloyl-ACP methyl ester carboxylesterase
MWHKVAPRLAQEFTVIATDLRGYGDSAKPPSAPDHEPYSKRAMAREQVEVMRRLGFRPIRRGRTQAARPVCIDALNHNPVDRDALRSAPCSRPFDAPS